MRLIDADAVIARVEKDIETAGAILNGKAPYDVGAQMMYIAREVKSCLKEYLDVTPTLDLAPKWISVEDRLPEEEKEVLCYLGNALGKGIVVAFRRNEDWYFDGWKCPTVTHWMPLPETPKEG